MQTQLKLKLTALFFCFFLTFSLSDADEHNQIETLERLLREASKTLVTFLDDESLTTEQHDVISVWNKLIVTSLASLGSAQYAQILTIVNRINNELGSMAKTIQVLNALVNNIKPILAQIKDEISKLKASGKSKN